MRKVVRYCYIRGLWFVWDKQLLAERGQFATNKQAQLCADQLELF